MPVFGLLLVACTGPELRLHNPEGHRIFVDGNATSQETVPFRYYGRVRCDALPADLDGRADFAHRPGTETIALAAPASPWLFPLDFPLELLARLANGRGDRDVEIAVPATPATARVEGQTPPIDLGAFVERARAARGSR